MTPRALIVVDLQNDFIQGGALAAPNTAPLPSAINAALDNYDIVAASLDWHPSDHASFIGSPNASNAIPAGSGALWPPHCIEFTHGALPAQGFDTSRVNRFFPKGTHPLHEQYSCVTNDADAPDAPPQPIIAWLKEHNVDSIDVVGLVLEVCVAATAKDLASHGFKTRILLPLVGALGTDTRNIDEARQAGVVVVH